MNWKLLFWTSIVFSLVLSMEAIAAAGGYIGPLTVATSIELTDEASNNYTEVWLAALSACSDTPAEGFGIRWRRIDGGWFPAWQLEATAPAGVFPPQFVDGTIGNLEYIQLPAAPLMAVRPGIYSTVLSYDPAARRLSFSVVDTTAKEELWRTGLYVEPFTQELHPSYGLVAADNTVVVADEKALKLRSLQADSSYSDQGLLLQLQRDFAWDLVSSSDTENRSRIEFFTDESLGLRLDWPTTPVPGKVRLSITSAGKKIELATAMWDEQSQTVFLPPNSELPIGKHNFVLEHVDGNNVRVIGSKPYSYSLNRLSVTYDIYGRNYNLPTSRMGPELDPDPGIYGRVTVQALRSVENATLRVEASYVETELVTVPAGADFKRLPQSTLAYPLAEQSLSLAAGESIEIPFVFDIPPGDGYVQFQALVTGAPVEVVGGSTETRVLRAPMVPAFPGAEGFGAYTPGGRGGRVYVVTNLNDSGPGSLRAAVSARGPRIVVFAVSGTIRLKSQLKIGNPYITIAGNTAPGDGITIADYTTQINTHDVILRHLRFRLGDVTRQSTDALDMRRGTNVIIDHVSTSWGIDEVLSISESDRVTVQWSMITEGLNESYHYKGVPHGRASLIRGSYGARYTFHHNLWAHHQGRMPAIANDIDRQLDPIGLLVDLRNNVVYNWLGMSPAGHLEIPEAITLINNVNNYYKTGPNSQGAFVLTEGCFACKTHISGASMNGAIPEDQWSLIIGELSDEYKHPEPFPAAWVKTESAYDAFESVLKYAGAQPRDPVDARVINDVREETGRIINSQNDVGGWPEMKTDYSLVADANNNGIPDWWYAQYGLDPHQWLDPAGDLDGDGYTNIEEYINGTHPAAGE